MSTFRNSSGKSWRRSVAAGLVFALALVLVVGVIVVQANLVPDIVDFVRELPFVGPDRMAALENVYYDAQDAWTQFVYDHTHGPVVMSDVAESDMQPTVEPESPDALPLAPVPPTLVPTQASTQTANPPLATLSASPTVPLQKSAVRSVMPPTGGKSWLPKTSTVPTPTPTAWPTLLPPSVGADGTVPSNLPPSIPPLIVSDPQIGEGIWTSIGMPLVNGGPPPLWHTFYRPDPTRPYVQVYLVWMDPTRTQLTLVPGTTEPRAIDGTHGAGEIPPAVQSGGKLLAAWNGGFLTINGAYGMMLDRHLILPARPGFATLAQYADGSMKIGVWGQDIQVTPELVSFRQNGPILIDQGAVNENGLLAWGSSLSGATHVWRSGIGLTANGALIYAAGNWLSAQTLGLALQKAGAVEAMQLDINAWHTFFFTYMISPQGPVATKLNATMPGPSQLYLTPYSRDFMYLTLKQ